jgi:hypothetical protein
MSIPINGEGGKLWGVVNVDSDRSYDSTLQMWLADDEEHLKKQILEEWLQDYEEGEWMWKETTDDFESAWGNRILPNEIDVSGFIKPWTKL